MMPFLGWNSGKFEGKCDVQVIVNFNYILYGIFPFCAVTIVVIVVLHFLIYQTA
jgi:hypothetical protein